MATILRFISISLLFFLGITQSFSQTNCIRIEYETIASKGNEKVRKKSKLAKIGYVKYDATGNIIENGRFINQIYSIGGNKSIGDTDLVIFRTFNQDNRLMEESYWKYNGNKKSDLIYRTTFVYDKNGRLAQELKIDSFSKYKIQTNHLYSENRIVTIDSILNLYPNASKKFIEGRRDTTLLDSAGRVSEKLYYVSNNNFINRYVYLYDKFGFGKTELRYDGIVSNLYAVTDYQFDYTKKLIRTVTIIVGKNHEQKEVFSYNKSGWIDKVLRFIFDKQTGYIKYEYISEQ